MPQQIEKDLARLEQDLYVLSSKYPDLARTAASAKINFELGKADAVDTIAHDATIRESKITVAEKDALATKQISKAIRERYEAEAELDSAKKQIDILQSILSSVQSRVKLILIERGLDGYKP